MGLKGYKDSIHTVEVRRVRVEACVQSTDSSLWRASNARLRTSEALPGPASRKGADEKQFWMGGSPLPMGGKDPTTGR